tara:strand:- start:1013 stop:1729 length:717 start_codon:yes stop_codon:yes gene_type:complete
MKSFIEKKLKSLLYFIELNFKIRFGNKSAIDIYYDNLSQECYDFFKSKMKSSSIFLKVEDIRNFAIYKAIENSKNSENIFLEFGVYTGGSINLFSKQLKTINANISGFDTFEGLTEDWLTHVFFPKGSLSLNSKLPKVEKNVRLIKGKIQDTLSSFLDENSKKKIMFAHMDMDTYSSTKYALTKIKPFLRKGSVILFDELYGYPNWQQEEYKAFTEVFNENEYKFIAFCESEAAIEIK